jgi:hypothetical protein
MDGGGSVKTISEETVILPVVVAGAVISELAVYLQGKGIVLKVGDELADKLAERRSTATPKTQLSQNDSDPKQTKVAPAGIGCMPLCATG